LKKILALGLALVGFAMISCCQGFSAGYQTVEFSAAHLGGLTIRFNIILPGDYNTSSRRFPVLYLLHGYTGNYMRWVTRSGITDYAKTYQEIIVMSDAQNGWYVNNYTHPEMKWEDYIIKDLIPYVDAHYRTIAFRAGRAIAGVSMGGFGAMMLGLKYTDMFIAVASLSGALASAEAQFETLVKDEEIRLTIAEDFGPPDNPSRPGEDPFWLVQRLTPNRCPHIFIAIGEGDEFLEDNRKFVKLLGELGIRYRYYEVPGEHTWQVFDEQIQNVLRLEAPILNAEPETLK
jgi:putative tributyrin esterase